MKTRNLSIVAAISGVLAIGSPAALANNAQIKVTHAGSYTTPTQYVQRTTPAAQKSFQIGFLTGSKKKGAVKTPAPVRASKFIHR